MGKSEQCLNQKRMFSHSWFKGYVRLGFGPRRAAARNSEPLPTQRALCRVCPQPPSLLATGTSLSSSLTPSLPDPCAQMSANPGTWARRVAIGIDLTKPGQEQDHFLCAAYYSCTETGFAEIVQPGMHVWVATKYVYDANIDSDKRAPAYEPILISHLECTADGLGIQVFGYVLLNWPRLHKYKGEYKLPKCMKDNPSMYTYTNWEISAPADVQEGFVGVRIGRPSSPPDLSKDCEDTIGVACYTKVSTHP
jgi:hypothetical protein